MGEARNLLEDLARQLARRDEQSLPMPEASPPGRHTRLCVGMSVYDDFDGVYFTIQSIRLGQPEVLADTSFLILDNHPEGAAAEALRGLADSIPDVRYVPFRGYRSTAVRDLVFREADADIVLCVDSHVLLRPGSLQALLDYFAAHPESADIVQGPLLDDTLRGVMGTHFTPKWGSGMFGQWAVDERVHDSSGEPFEIEMQGLGAFACRRDAWPGLNPRLRGFGGEEGYLHEKFRQAGGRAICLPALAWAHRFARPASVAYPLTWLDRVRNYLIGWSEIGWDTDEVDAHFLDHVGSSYQVHAMLRHAHDQVADPLTVFDAVVCIATPDEPDRWDAMSYRLKMLGIDWRAERFDAPAASDEQRRRVLACRALVDAASRRGYRSMLLLDDEVRFLDHARTVLDAAVADLADRAWDFVFLGGCDGNDMPALCDGSRVLQMPRRILSAHAIALGHAAFQAILDALPSAEGAAMDAFLDAHQSLEGWISAGVDDGTFSAFVTFPRVTSVPHLLVGEDAILADRFIL